MFTIDQHVCSQAFIRQRHTGFINGAEAVKFCMIEFERQDYHDGLFAQLAIPMPTTVATAQIKRRADYLAGRYAAHHLLRLEDCRAEVAIGSTRAPIWPAGWCGSISHSDKWAIAVLSPQRCRFSPGVDIEMLNPAVLRGISAAFTTANERVLITHSPFDTEIALLITFSAKESLFKALYPLVRYRFGFETAELCGLQNNRFTLRLTRQLSPSLPAGYCVSGRYYLDHMKVVTLILVATAR